MQNDFDDPASAGEHATRERNDDTREGQIRARTQMVPCRVSSAVG